MSYGKHLYSNNKEDIITCLTTISPSMVEYIQSNPQSRFTLWYKSITHSDLSTKGKRNGLNEGLDKNLLYYLTLEELQTIEANSEKPFESAKQSNIGLPLGFYEELGIPRIQRRKGAQKTRHEHVLLNDYVDVQLVNDSLYYFNESYTIKVLTKLKKICPWKGKSIYNLSDGLFTPIVLTEAIHGLGVSTDSLFANLRLSIFLNDTIYFVIEKNLEKRTSLYILLEKNPLFYTITGLANNQWERYLETTKRQKDAKIASHLQLPEEDEKSRKRQAAWKRLLAKEMMNYTTHEGEVFCPFTKISANFEDVSSLFIASHIKRYADSESEEAYDINNGLLLCANADALFDKHLITVTEEKKIRFSFLIDRDMRLKSDLKLNQDIFIEILNDKRMEYMADHRRIFYKKEEQRKSGNLLDEDFEDIDEVEPEVSPNPAQQMVAEEDLSFSLIKGGSEFQHTRILVGCYKNASHLKWIEKNYCYNIRIDQRKGSAQNMLSQISKAEFLIVYNSDNIKKYKIYTIVSGKKATGYDLNKLGYPNAKDSSEYFLFSLMDFNSEVIVDVDNLLAIVRKDPNYVNNSPFFVDY